MTEIKKDQESFDISSLPISSVEWGKEVGREEGRVEGREEGREAEQERVALKMLQDGLAHEKILQYTNLTSKQLNELKKKL